MNLYRYFLLFILLSGILPTGVLPIGTLTAQQNQAPAYWQQQIDYAIDVSLNDHDHTLDGFVRMQYSNHSPDTLSFIWIHLWPNAYKTDRTAFSDQLLDNGRTDFYFSDRGQKGYINHLDFRVDGQAARTEDHPQFIDIIRIWLPRPLLPGQTINISTPFHEQLPFNFSRGGHVDRSYQITQWYPKPAVYDSKGWHEMPYLDQGEFFGEFGSFDVRITLPQTYTVAAPGSLQPGSPSPIAIPIPSATASSSAARKVTVSHKPPPRRPGASRPGNRTPAAGTLVERPTKTLHYIQENVHDFAWFADQHYHAVHDTLRLPSGRIIDIYAYYLPASAPAWRSCIADIKAAVLFRSSLIGEYPYATVSIAEAKTGTPGGMEYPAIASISPLSSPKDLDLLIEHEIGHNWFQAALASNERRYPWMDEGLNSYYDKRYEHRRYPAATSSSPATPHANNGWLLNKLPADPGLVDINTLAKEKKDQPIASPSEAFTAENYNLIPYDKTAAWLRTLQDTIGIDRLDASMQEYFRRWQFRHPYPEDFRSILENTSGRDLSAQFALLDIKGPATPQASHKKIRPTFLFNLRHTDSISYINILPAIGRNKYDGAMIGLLIHNYDLPPNDLQFVLAPLYATSSHRLDGIGRVSYKWYPDASGYQLETGAGAEKFSSVSSPDSNGHKLFGGFYKIAPFLRLTFANTHPKSTMEKWIEWKTYFIGENQPGNYIRKSTDSLYYPSTVGKYDFRYLNQLSARIADNRVLYPYAALVQLQQADRFYRINVTGNYFFNYAAGGGMSIRLFAAKFGYLGGNGSNLDLTRFQPKLTGVSGSEDYTYSNYFSGRNEYNGFSSQQIMMRDGDLKIRTPSFPWLEGRSDDWVSALNFNTTLPPSIVPAWMPLTFFFDVGTYAAAWKTDPLTSHFLYTGGFELSFFHNVFHFYAPIVYSSDFRDQLKTIPDQNSFWKRLSFSIDIQNLNFNKLFGNIPR